jgi:hypothetical protein
MLGLAKRVKAKVIEDPGDTQAQAVLPEIIENRVSAQRLLSS